MEYATLNSPNHEIRLLLLAPGRFEDEIVCALIYTNLHVKPAFEALSYTWGSPENPKTITLDGRVFPVGVNLETALRHLRYEDAQRLLWIDAICVNQGDLVERSEQVLLMRDVYENAQNVVVWLGENEDGSDIALSYLKLLAKESARLKYDYRKAKLPKHNPQIIASLSKFFQRPWFTRVWVLQEVAVSKQASILCGKHSLPWNELCYASWFLHDQALTQRKSGLKDVGSYVVVILSMFMTNRLLPSELADHTSNILELLSTFQYCDATNARDKIYALLGLASDIPPTPSPISPNIPEFKPNYTETIAKVYTTFAHHQILNTNSLSLITKRTTQNPDHNLPSWVPDWTQYNPIQTASSSRRLPSSVPYASYLNTPDPVITIPVASFSPDLTILTVRGYRLAIITSVELPSNQSNDVESKIVDFLTDGLMFTLGLGARAGMRLFGVRKKMAALIDGPEIHGQTFPKFSAPFSTFGVDDKYITTIGPKKSAQTQPRAFSTGKGEMGVTWAEARSGDWICSWVGSEHFFVVRDGGDGFWRFVGGAVVTSWILNPRAGERDGQGDMETFSIK